MVTINQCIFSREGSFWVPKEKTIFLLSSHSKNILTGTIVRQGQTMLEVLYSTIREIFSVFDYSQNSEIL